MAVCRTLQGGSGAGLGDQTSVFDAFSAIDTIVPNAWADVGGTLDGTASTGIIISDSGLATTTANSTLHTAYFSIYNHAPTFDTTNGLSTGAGVSTEAYREVTLSGVKVADTLSGLGVGGVSILMDMATDTPVYTTGLRMKVERLRDTGSGILYWNVTLYINDVPVKTGTLSPATTNDLTAMRLSIDSGKTIRCWLDSYGFVPVITYNSGSYNPAGGRAGVALKSNDFFKASADSFKYVYTLEIVSALASSDLAAHAIVASANGVVYIQKKDGNLATLLAPSCTLASDRLLSSVNRLQKLYIADYGLLRYSASTGSNATTTFTDSGTSDWTAFPIDSDVIVNGGFAADANWTKGTGWTIGAGVATATGAISTDLTQIINPLVVGRTYRVVFTVTRTAGSVTANCGATAGTARSSSSTFTEDILCATTGVFKFSTSGFTGTVDVVSATAIVTAASIIASYRLEILSGTNAPIGIYNITAASTTLTLSPTPPRNGSSLRFRVVRCAKILDTDVSGTVTLTKVPIGNVPDAAGLAVLPGQYPLGCTIVSAWDDRLLWSGDPLFPHVAYMSKQGDPDNYLYANETEGEAFAYDPARVSGAAQIGDAVTAIIPHSHDYCIFAGYRSFTIQRGDPTIGGALDLISREIGITNFAAWCWTPEQLILGLSGDGLYLFQASPDAAPTRVSRERLPKELLNINTSLYDAQMAFDVEKQGVIIAVTPKIEGSPGTYFFFDWQKKAFWPESYTSYHEPTAMCAHTMSDSSTRTVIFGCRDGYLRNFVDASGLDDGNVIPTSALLGPFMLGSPSMIGLLHRIWLELDNRSAGVTVDILVGSTPAKARAALPAYSFTLSQSGDTIGPSTEICRLRGGAAFVRLTNSSGSWALESAALEREIVGERREIV
jgi:hypothetical protein